MWIAMQHRHRMTGNTAPIMESKSFGPFDDQESAEKYAHKHYGGDLSYSVHEVFAPAPKHPEREQILAEGDK